MISASSGQHIHGTINAAGCNLGIFIGPGMHDVVVSHTTITGSKDHGIFVENATRVRIEHNVVSKTVTDPNPNISEDKAIELVGTSNSIVGWNLVTDTVGSGGVVHNSVQGNVVLRNVAKFVVAADLPSDVARRVAVDDHARDEVQLDPVSDHRVALHHGAGAGLYYEP